MNTLLANGEVKREGGRMRETLTIFGLAACNAWARAKHFGCHSVIHSVCYPEMPL